MFRLLRCSICLALVGFGVHSAAARTWTDKTGKYTIEADLIGYDDEMVILQRENKELGSCPIDQLSDEDREYLKSKQAQEIHDKNIKATQTWTTADGLKVTGRIVDYARDQVTLQRRRGKTYVNDKPIDNLPEVYRTMLPKIVSHFEETDVPDRAALDAWVRKQRGIPVEYTLEGVILELENGDEYGVPFFLLSEGDQQVLKPGWETWLADQDDYEKRDDHAFRLQGLAATYHQDQQVNQQIAMMNLNLQAIQSGLTSMWEVTLYPTGNYYRPIWVVTMGRNSEIATQRALAQHPGYTAGPVRRVSR